MRDRLNRSNLPYYPSVLPYVIVSTLSTLFGGYSERTRARLEYMVAVKLFVTIASWAIITVVAFALLFNQMNQVEYWLTIFHVIVTGMVFTLCMLIHKLLLQVIAVQFHRLAYKDRIAISKRHMKLLDAFKKYAKQHRSNSEYIGPGQLLPKGGPQPSNPSSPIWTGRFAYGREQSTTNTLATDADSQQGAAAASHRKNKQSASFWLHIVRRRAADSAGRNGLPGDLDDDDPDLESGMESDVTEMGMMGRRPTTVNGPPIPPTGELAEIQKSYPIHAPDDQSSPLPARPRTTSDSPHSLNIDSLHRSPTVLARNVSRKTARSRPASRAGSPPSSPGLRPITASDLLPTTHTISRSTRPSMSHSRAASARRSDTVQDLLSPSSPHDDKHIRSPIPGLTEFKGNRYKQELARMDITSHIQAGKLAKKIFMGLGGKEKGFLTSEDFMRCFADPSLASEAFLLLDQDGNGSITRKEVKDCVVGMYRERRGLYRAMRDLSQALGKLNSFFFFVDSFVSFCIALPIFGISLTAMLPFTSFILALSFVFGTAARTAFESLLFLFVTHPYDAGDRVLIDNQNLLVEEVGVLTTIFKRMDGQLIYAPNTLIASKLIHNLRRSGDQVRSLGSVRHLECSVVTVF
ncbi:uncharacterized protein EV422DRAFT_104771 [Fimicolochytrium jonesii]|uniref:uncharacterized protein n=1 Tax=Fimicolochytrium jonesii TaxID=1396493 RepID=UPI0022FE7DB4|nr:uncharacterized protein EV422DRAFT_104771 [Fimicolochytrium jonesii]KAI8819729.1 hypothetical protein EV422DRAFT_104771 [Fimicolochytrium jonesii]